jgi:uncharacterized membrane protein YjjB (DUF3815 family)
VKIFWKILAAVLAAMAVYFVVVSNFERAFVCAALGAVAWFLNYRALLREKLGNTDDTDERDVDEENL